MIDGEGSLEAICARLLTFVRVVNIPADTTHCETEEDASKKCVAHAVRNDVLPLRLQGYDHLSQSWLFYSVMPALASYLLSFLGDHASSDDAPDRSYADKMLYAMMGYAMQGLVLRVLSVWFGKTSRHRCIKEVDIVVHSEVVSLGLALLVCIASEGALGMADGSSRALMYRAFVCYLVQWMLVYQVSAPLLRNVALFAAELGFSRFLFSVLHHGANCMSRMYLTPFVLVGSLSEEDVAHILEEQALCRYLRLWDSWFKGVFFGRFHAHLYKLPEPMQRAVLAKLSTPPGERMLVDCVSFSGFLALLLCHKLYVGQEARQTLGIKSLELFVTQPSFNAPLAHTFLVANRSSGAIQSPDRWHDETWIVCPWYGALTGSAVHGRGKYIAPRFFVRYPLLKPRPHTVTTRLYGPDVNPEPAFKEALSFFGPSVASFPVKLSAVKVA